MNINKRKVNKIRINKYNKINIKIKGNIVHLHILALLQAIVQVHILRPHQILTQILILVFLFQNHRNDL